MNLARPETRAAFQYIGGVDGAVESLSALADQELKGNFAVRKPLILITGPAGMGKSALTKATARAFNATLVSKKIVDFFSDRGFSIPLIGAGYDEAKVAAANNSTGKAVYAIEAFDVAMVSGPQPLISEFVIDMMDRWSEDHKGGVMVIATAIDKACLLPPVLSRFTQIPLNRPDRAGAADICVKNMARLSAALKRTDIFSSLDGIEDLAVRMVELEWTARDITTHLRSAIALRNQKEPWEPIDVSFLASRMPLPPRLGFARPLNSH